MGCPFIFMSLTFLSAVIPLGFLAGCDEFSKPLKRVGCILFGCDFAALCSSRLCGLIKLGSTAWLWL